MEWLLLAVSLAVVAVTWAVWIRPKGSEEALTPGVSPATIIDDDELRDWFTSRRCCPDCGSTEFISGPCGGCAQNVLCPECHSEFNLGLPLFVHRNGGPGEGRLDVFGVQPLSEAH